VCNRHDLFWLVTSTVILACNALDAALTVGSVELGDAIEANPLMAALLAHDTLQFVLVKHLMVSLGVILLWRLRSRRMARLGAMAVLPVYPLVVAYELASVLT